MCYAFLASDEKIRPFENTNTEVCTKTLCDSYEFWKVSDNNKAQTCHLVFRKESTQVKVSCWQYYQQIWANEANMRPTTDVGSKIIGGICEVRTSYVMALSTTIIPASRSWHDVHLSHTQSYSDKIRHDRAWTTMVKNHGAIQQNMSKTANEHSHQWLTMVFHGQPWWFMVDHGKSWILFMFC